MRNREVKMKPLAASILSLSLLTVMAGAAVAPALEVIRRHFSDASQLEVQLVVCMPALFIVITNMFFGRLASRFGARTLTMPALRFTRSAALRQACLIRSGRCLSCARSSVWASA